MSQGRILRIQVTPEEGGPVREVAEVQAHAGRGLEGDYRHARASAANVETEPSEQITLIEKEAIDALARETGLVITHADTRRNVYTEGVALNHLVDREFRAGELRLRGEELCEPCGGLEAATAPGVRQGLVHRGGLRARIVEGGRLRVGDEVGEIE